MTEGMSLSERNELLTLRERVREVEADNAVLKARVRELESYISVITQEGVTYDDLQGDEGKGEDKQVYHTLKRVFDGKVFLAVENNGSLTIPETGEVIRNINLLDTYDYEILS